MDDIGRLVPAMYRSITHAHTVIMLKFPSNGGLYLVSLKMYEKVFSCDRRDKRT